MKLKINEVAKITGITVRTLHYYDEIGLLIPNEITDSGYRIYNEDALETLQQILFFRELDFSLRDIKEIIKNPHYNKSEALIKHRELLLQKRSRLDNLITLLDNTIKGEKAISFKEFDISEIETNKKRYALEIKERWGNTEIYKESEEKTSSYDETQWKIISGDGGDILKAFGEIRNSSPNIQHAQNLVKQWQEYITKNFYKCTKEILSCLGLMYISDERFLKNIDKNGEGTAEFMAKAIEIYCKNDIFF